MQKALVLALLLTGLFFSSGFKVFAADQIGNCAIGDVLAGVGCTTAAPSAQLYRATTGYLTENKTFSDKDETKANAKACAWYLGVTSSATSSGFRECTSGRAYKYKECNWLTRPDGTGYCDYSGGWRSGTTPGSTYLGAVDFYCPPEDSRFQEFQSLHTVSPTVKLCTKPFDPVTCPTESNGNIVFHVGQKGAGSACVTMDDGSICPFTESPTAGYYTPNYENPSACVGQSGEDPNAKPDCSPNGAGQLVCKADPSEKCSASNGLLQCEEGCGYLNDVFMCFPDPEEPDEPDEPDVPDPTPDDDITDPNKPMADMVKSDFKDVMKGVETRLNSTKKELEDVQKNNDKNTKSLNEALKGLGSKIDKTNNKLDGIQETLDDTLYGEELDDSGLNDDAAMKAGLGITGNEQLSDLKFADVDIDSFRSQFAPFLNTSQCPAPRTITIKGNSYALDWAPFCEFFAALSYLVLAAAYLLVPFIVFGGKK